MGPRFVVLVGTLLFLAASGLPHPTALGAPDPHPPLHPRPAEASASSPAGTSSQRTSVVSAPDSAAEPVAGPLVVSAERPPDPQHHLLPGGSAPSAPSDLRRPRLAATGAPDLPHPAPPHLGAAEPVVHTTDLHLVRQTKDRGS